LITSKQIINNLEQYVDARKTSNGYVQIFSNPSKSELNTIVQHSKSSSSSKCLVRFIADAKNKKVYVWDAYLAIHDDGRKILNFSTNIMQTPYLVNGVAWIANGKMLGPSWVSTETVIKDSGSKSNPKERMKCLDYLDQVFSYNWDWLDQHISKSSVYVDKKEKEFKTVR
jgi:hypothetical protein